MADIFISYSRKDAEQARLLTELLASAGLSVWIDQSGIDVATSWSASIVDAINDCKAFIVMLSPASVESHNVIKEVSLASEKRKKILPLDLEPVTLPRELEYQLAGIQRAPMTNIDSVIRALGKFGLEATGAPQAPKITHEEKDDRKALIILPFEDLSPTADNQWFADGLAGELIDMLGKIKSLRILDRKTSLDLRGVKQTTVEIGKLFNTRYFVEGSVRKFGDQIKISVSLLDIETGDHRWQESYKGVMADIFDLQESVAANVVEGLKLHLTKEEKSQLEERGTENSEAYELWMKANEYTERHTKEGCEIAVALNAEAICLDPNYLEAYVSQASSLVNLYRVYDRRAALLDRAELLCMEGQKRHPGTLRFSSPLAFIQMFRAHNPEAERIAKEWCKREPDKFYSYSLLGSLYYEMKQFPLAVEAHETSLKLKSDELASLINVVFSCAAAGDSAKCAQWANVALPYVEKFLRLHPDDEDQAVTRAMMLHYAGRNQDALETVRALADEHAARPIRDGRVLYNLGCLLGAMGNKLEALRIYRRAIEAGMRWGLAMLLTDETEGVAQLAGTPEYEELKRLVEEIEAATQEKKIA